MTDPQALQTNVQQGQALSARVQWASFLRTVQEDQVVVLGQVGGEGRAQRGVQGGVGGGGERGANVDLGHRDGGCAQRHAQELDVVDLVSGDLVSNALRKAIEKPPSETTSLRTRVQCSADSAALQ